ncbi:hypothetical protein B5P43_30175 [Bacillus sp. SRB_336]|nr:hypothetical protein B5P43_30175 [Bacillus sp. SRB_336]
MGVQQDLQSFLGPGIEFVPVFCADIATMPGPDQDALPKKRDHRSGIQAGRIQLGGPPCVVAIRQARREWMCSEIAGWQLPAALGDNSQAAT